MTQPIAAQVSDERLAQILTGGFIANVDEYLSMLRELQQARLSLTASEKPAYLRGKRAIVSAAVMLSDGVVVCGVRHFDKIMHAAIESLGKARGGKRAHTLLKGSIQGFVANDYEFVSREEAWIVALRAGQFDPKNATGTQGVLYSEDLW